MNKTLFCFLSFLLVLFTSLRGQSTYVIDSTLLDTAAIKVRHVDPDFFARYRADPDFDYSSVIGIQPNTFWENFVRWIIRHLNLPAGYFKALNIFIRIFFWVLIAAILIFAISRMKLYKYFYTSETPPKKDFVIEGADEVAEDLEAAIQFELEHKNFRKALRYHFLNILRGLDEKGLISWSAEKTNIDYLKELKRHHTMLAPVFEVLVNTYNAVWYGHFSIDEADYTLLSRSFVEFNVLIHAKG